MSSNKVIELFNTLNFVSDYNGVGLTSASNRLTIDSGGILNIFNTTQSQSSNVGALVLQNGGLSINALTNATSVSNGGALTVAGGAAIAGDLIVGGTISYSNAAAASSTFAYLTLTATDQSTDIANGTLVVFGGISVQTDADATSITSGGGMTLAGGLAVYKSLYVGGTSTLQNIIGTNISVNNASITNEVATNISTTTLSVTSSTIPNFVATNITSITAIITNGLQATGNSNTIGSIFTTGDNIGIGTTSPASEFRLDINGTLRAVASTGSLHRLIGSHTSEIVQIQNTNISGGSAFRFLNNSGASQASFGFNNAISNTFQNSMQLTSIASVPINIAAGNKITNPVIFNASDNSVSITATTDASDTSSGALKVSGGVGIVGDLYVGGEVIVNSPLNVTINNTRFSSNSSTGAMQLVGGLSINIKDTTNSNATSYTTGGGITLNGGLAVAQDTFLGGILDIQSGSNNMNPIKLQSIQISSNYNNGASTVIQSGNAARDATSFTPIAFSGWNDQANSKLTINASTIVTGNALTATNNSHTIGNIFTTGGNVGIGTTNPTALLTVNGAITAGNVGVTAISVGSLNASTGITASNINFTGDIFKNGTLYVSNVSSQWLGTTGNILYYGTTGSGHLVGIGTSNPTQALDVVGSIRATTSITTTSLFSTNQTTTNIVATNLSTGILNAGNLTTGNINFTGVLSQNGAPYNIGSQWSGTTGTFLYYGSTGNINVGIGTTNPLTTLDVNGTLRTQSLTVQDTTDANSASYGSIVAAGGIGIGKSVNVGGSVILNNVCATSSGTFDGANGPIATSNITGLVFTTSTYRSFSILMSVTVARSAGGNLNAQFTIEGIQRDAGWYIYVSSLGDTIDITFNITAAGQLQYSSDTTYPNWTSTKLNYQVTAIYVTGGFNTFSLPGGTTTISTPLVMTNTTDSISPTTGALTVDGGVGIAKTLHVGTGINTPNVNLGVSSMFSGSFIATNNISSATNVTGLVFSNADIRYFEAKIVITITKTDTTTLDEIITLRGNLNDIAWQLFTENIGDVSGITFTINASGQVQYTSSNITNFSSGIFRFSAQQYTKTGTYTSIPVTTTGSYLMGSVQLTSTQNAVSGTSVGALQTLGGITVEKDLVVKGNIMNVPQFAVFEEQQANTVDPTNYSAGSYVTRTLNTSVNNTIIGSSLNANQFTLPAGTYKIKAFCPNYAGLYSKAVLYNVTSIMNTIYGTNCYANGAVSVTYSIISNIFTIISTSTFEIKQYFSTSNLQMGGVPVSSGQIETYTHVEITKLS